MASAGVPWSTAMPSDFSINPPSNAILNVNRTPYTASLQNEGIRETGKSMFPFGGSRNGNFCAK